MIYKYGTVNEVYATASRLPDEVFTELLRSAAVLDSEYGEDRDPCESGGYSIVAETADDLPALLETVNIDSHPCEWAMRVGSSGFISALYVFSNDYAIMVFMPQAIAPQTILNELA